MKMIRSYITGVLVLMNFFCIAQEGFTYQRSLSGIQDTWHTIQLPNEIFKSIKDDLSDIRIYGYTTSSDTIEAPYILENSRRRIIDNDISFNLLNQSKNESGFYYTFEIPDEKTLNELDLEFNKDNFDFRVRLEGSNDQSEWFVVQENYRIVSIRNDLTDYSFTRIRFPGAKYKYFRLNIDSQEDPRLSAASIKFKAVEKAVFAGRQILHRKDSIGQDKSTIIDLRLEDRVPISRLKFDIGDELDYYRKVNISVVRDSVISEKGTKYLYSNIGSGILSSLEDNAINFTESITDNLRIQIVNNDNAALNISSVEAYGINYYLKARFSEEADYFLTYGNKLMKAPNYDIVRFAESIPNESVVLSLGDEVSIEKQKAEEKPALFISKRWLWVLILVIVVILGWFTIQLISKKSEESE